MIKINYPNDKESFENNYIEVIGLDESKWDNFTDKIECNTRKLLTIHQIKSFKEVLLLPFDKLLAIFKSFPELKVEKDDNGKKIKSIYQTTFDYEKLQLKIAKFFMGNSKELNLKTCYFCNIDYINTFDNSFDEDILYILQNGDEKELKSLNGIDKRAIKIIEYRNKNDINCIDDIEKVNGIGKQTIEKVQNTKIIKNHFTLDHFLPKAKCPLLALSLYNFVPSCYACNSKFKKEEELLETYLSPSSKDFSVDKDMKFKFYYKDKIDKKDFNLELVYPEKIAKYINVFKLKGRYSFHKSEAEELIQKQEEYSDSRIDEIANILEIPSAQVKNDIFGKELFEGDAQDKSFTKLKRDIYDPYKTTF